MSWHLTFGAPGSLRRRLVGLYGLLAAANLLAWGWALVAFHDYPVLLGTALLAYSFGLRHAVDADHIAAIDNVTRKMMQEGKRPVAVGFFFSLGHSSVVVALSVAIAGTAAALQGRFSDFKEVGGIVGTGISALFLFAIAIANMIVLLAVYRIFRAVRRGGRYVEEDIDLLLANRGFLGRLFRRLFRVIEKAGTCIRSACCSASASTRQPRSGCSAFPRPRRRKGCQSGRSWCFPRCSPPACRWWTRSTAS